ncbi:OLC1v1008930C1 [Oldenlandia corymbosa var. corymbosa]|uniref:OLC1v1008930C1 n=1 Tax=Oldenlandia corymbosa var. corymbosa TaxID=529605 RepID=A0AAV1DQ80_OLDCO|nr:OLC1v1008930C1 [Oldenlandia corymbosa var. corymbosa]
MKSSGQGKRKVLGVSVKGNKASGSPENCGKRSYKRREKTVEACESFLPEKQTREKPSSIIQSGDEKLLHRDQSITKTTGVQDSKLQNGNNSTPSKIKLQLFPINSTTQIKLEKDGHNPFLELTLSHKKKIPSIIKHLNSKWGSSDAKADELMLFPYDVRLERIRSCSRWTLNCAGITAGEVHAALGSPAIFRLRYGWYSDLQLEASGISFTSMVEEQLESKSFGADCNGFSGIALDQKSKCSNAGWDGRNSINKHEIENVMESRPLSTPVDDINACSVLPWDDSLTSLSIGGLLSEVSLLNKIKSSSQKSESKSNLQPIELVSDISVGALLSEASLLGKINDSDVRPGNNSSFLKTRSISDTCTEGILSNASFQSKSNDPVSKTENEAGFQLIHLDSELSIGGLMSEASLAANASDPTSSKNTLGKSTRSVFPWDDDGSISLSIGGLLSENSLQARLNGYDLKSKQSSKKLLSGLPTLGASVAAQHNQRSPMQKQLLHESFSSILDGEETCHAFSFKKVSSLNKDLITSKR